MKISCVLLVAIASTILAQSTPQNNPEIRKLFLADQCDRGEAVGCSKSSADLDTIQNDATRRARLHVLLTEGRVITGDDLHDAAYIFQHGSEANDYLLAHVLAMAAVAKGDVRSKWIAAASLDRYLQAIQQPQIFGTQYRQTTFYPPKESHDSGAQSPPNTKTPWTQTPYNPALVSDSVRLAYCVQPLARQVQAVESSGKAELTIPRVDGCER